MSPSRKILRNIQSYLDTKFLKKMMRVKMMILMKKKISVTLTLIVKCQSTVNFWIIRSLMMQNLIRKIIIAIIPTNFKNLKRRRNLAKYCFSKKKIKLIRPFFKVLQDLIYQSNHHHQQQHHQQQHQQQNKVLSLDNWRWNQNMNLSSPS